jgi:Mg-chelatase subunit ChlI
MRNHPLVDEFYQPDQVGMPKEDDNVHERNNRWALYSSLMRGIDKVRLIALWDGKNEMSEDLDVHLVKHMVDLMRDTGGQVEQINPAKISAEMLEANIEAANQNHQEKTKSKAPANSPKKKKAAPKKSKPKTKAR